jgi:hypothetical protein
MTGEPTQDSADLWSPFRFFLGGWEGTGTGKPGLSSCDRDYELILDDRFIQVRNRSVYEPQEANPEGEIHEDLGILSYDKTREIFVFREFHIEGYVNQYVLESWDREREILTLVTEMIENLAPGWQARTTYEILNDDEFRETFDLAGPGKDWACYITNEFKRVPTR